MTLTHFRAIWSYAGCYPQIVKHKAMTYTVTANMVKDFLALRAWMCSVRQFSVACPKANSSGEFPRLPGQNANSNSNEILQKYSFSTSCAHVKNAKTEEVVSTVLDDVDLEKIKEQVQNDRKKFQNNNILVMDRVKEMVAKKSDEKLANLGPEDQKKLKVIKLEHSFLFSEGHVVPNTEEMRSEYWLQALQLPSMAQRLKYYKFLAKRIFIKENMKLKQAAKKQQAQEDIEKPEKEPYEHGRIFMRIYESSMKRWLNYRLAASMQFGIPLVIDMDYVSHMHPREIKNTASQLHDLYVLNRLDEDLPFHLHFTSCQQDNPIFRLFQLRLQDDQGFLLTVSENSYLDLFDKDALVYLSPNGHQVMTEFDPNAVYIIGGFNDKAGQQPLSYARAKEQRIKCQRLPLDLYLKWNLGSKSLTLDQMMKIMTSLKNKKTWQEAFQAIPKRKLRHSEDSN